MISRKWLVSLSSLHAVSFVATVEIVRGTLQIRVLLLGLCLRMRGREPQQLDEEEDLPILDSLLMGLFATWISIPIIWVWLLELLRMLRLCFLPTALLCAIADVL